MTFDEYQEISHKTAFYPPKIYVEDNEGARVLVKYVYATLGLAGETGEVVEKIKKIVRNQHGKLTVEDKQTIEKELGDCLWYMAEICSLFGIKMSSVAKKNIQKLQDRLDRNVICSEGDDR